MKLPEKPTNPYMRHKPQTLRERSIRQGNAVVEDVDGAVSSPARPEAIRSRSAALTRFISSGRLRNHGQNSAHHNTPSAAMTQNGVVQVPNSTSSPEKMNGLTAPTSRLKVQTNPWAKPRSLGGIQSATTRAHTGKPPA